MKSHRSIGIVLVTFCLLRWLAPISTASAEDARIAKDIEYASIDEHSLKLDLYLPAVKNPPLVVWIHGGGWKGGSKQRCPLSTLTGEGYAVASISYRLSQVAIFPAQIHDCKAAVRWLRANAEQYGYNTNRIAVAGSSAGGHLAALLGVTGGVAELEGTVGGNLDQSSRVDAIVDYYGPTDFIQRIKTQPHKTLEPSGSVTKLLGGPADQNLDLARIASPAFHVSPDDPPLLIFHGDQDKTVLLGQSERIAKAYGDKNLPAALRVIGKAGHGGNQFYSGDSRTRLVRFLDQHLKTTPNLESKCLPRSTPESQGVESAAIREFVLAADSQVDTMHSFMVVRHGQVIAEGWWAPEAAEKPHILWSLSKSFTSTAVGLAVAEGKLDIDDKVLSFFPDEAPENPSANLRAMRVRDLLTMSAGHDPLPALRDQENWVETFLQTPVPNEPGSQFLYNTPATFMQSAIVQKVTGETVLDYLTPRLFEPLGIDKPTWDTSPQGISIGGYGLYLRTEDIAKFGQLLLQQGKWGGKQIVSADWIAQATSRQIANADAPSGRNPDWRQGYGFQFWQCQHDAFRGDGKDGQFCIVLPNQDAVIAITAKTGNMQQQLDLVWEHLLPAFQDEALPENPAELDRLKQTLASLQVKTSNNASPQATNLPQNRENFHLFLLAGQSNMAGRGQVEPQDRTPHPRVLMLNKAEAWVPAVDPLHFDKPGLVGVGLGKTFAIQYAEQHPDVVVGLIPCAVGGSPIDSWAVGGFHSSTKTHPYDDCLKRMQTALPQGTLKGILWHQGESDSNPSLAPTYETKLQELVERFRKAFQSPDVPFIAGQMGQFPERPWTDERKLVDQVHQSLPDKLPGTAFVPSSGLNHKGDHVHFDAASYRELGRRYFQAYQTLVEAKAEK